MARARPLTWLRRLGAFCYKTTRARIIAYLRENPGWRGLVEIDEGARLGILSPIWSRSTKWQTLVTLSIKGSMTATRSDIAIGLPVPSRNRYESKVRNDRDGDAAAIVNLPWVRARACAPVRDRRL